MKRADLLRLAPVMLIVGGLSLAALADAAATSVGLDGRPGATAGLHAYRTVLGHPGFWQSYWFSVWVAVASTAIAAGGAVLIAFGATRRHTRRGRTPTVLHLSIGIPHIVWAVALVALLSPSGWLARAATWIGLIDRPAQFPFLVNDPTGFGIIIHLVTKELPFILLAVLPLSGLRAQRTLAQAATLGASTLAQLRLVYLPAVAPAWLPATIGTFAFGLGAYEPAAILGVQRPRTLSVVALEWFRAPDLAMRQQAFALALILLVTVVIGAAALVLATRSWWTLRAGRIHAPAAASTPALVTV